MSGENCDERMEDSGKRQFYIDSILHRKKLEPPSTEIEGENVNQCSGTPRGYPAYEKLSKYEDEQGGSNSKRARTIFTAEQLEQMEREFQKQQYVVGHERMYLANALNLTEAQVKVWFQNRRIKWRKQHMISEQNKLYTLTDDEAPKQEDPRAQVDKDLP